VGTAKSQLTQPRPARGAPNLGGYTMLDMIDLLLQARSSGRLDPALNARIDAAVCAVLRRMDAHMAQIMEREFLGVSNIMDCEELIGRAP